MKKLTKKIALVLTIAAILSSMTIAFAGGPRDVEYEPGHHYIEYRVDTYKHFVEAQYLETSAEIKGMFNIGNITLIKFDCPVKAIEVCINQGDDLEQCEIIYSDNGLIILKGEFELSHILEIQFEGKEESNYRSYREYQYGTLLGEVTYGNFR